MRITALCEYAIRCLLVLARSENSHPVSTRAMVEIEGLSRDYVEQIMLRLRRAGLVESLRGVHGGYKLARSPEQISALDVVRALEHNCFEIICRRHVGSETGCADSESCAIRSLCLGLREATEGVLAEASLARMAEYSAAPQPARPATPSQTEKPR